MLNLKDNLALSISESGEIRLLDVRDYHIVANDTSAFVYTVPGDNGIPGYEHALFHLWAHPAAESWRVTPTEPQSVIGNARAQDELQRFQLRLPRQSHILEMWHTGRGQQLINDAIPGVGMENGPTLVAADECEILFYSVNTRNCLLIQFSQPGTFTLEKSDVLLPAVVGTPEWEIVADDAWDEIRDLPNKPEIAPGEEARVRQNTWELVWQSNQPGEVEVVIYQGVVDVARHFEGRLALNIPDVSADFGPFFYQMVLGGLPLNLRTFDGFLAPRCNVIMGHVPAYADAWSREEAFAYEPWSLVDPVGVARLTEDYIRLASKYSQTSDSQRSPVAGFFSRHLPDQPPAASDYWDDAAPEFLMLAELHYRLTGDAAFAQDNLALYRRCADFILARIRPGEALPITEGTWDAQGVLIGKEPYFIAECYYGLNRFGDLLESLGDVDGAAFYREKAAAMQAAALTDYREGGLWHTERGTFINHVDYKPPQLRSPRTESWVTAEPQAEGLPRTEFALYETVVPIWLGLLDDEARIRQAFEWIDATYSYASGRGGVSFPPFYQQTFIAFLDVSVRHKYGLPGADRLLQLILDQALVGGLPITEWQFGAYRGTGSPDWSIPFYPSTHTGRIWDNCPYFGLVMSQHYGLSYTFDGWQINDPHPLAYYPLTRLNGLRYHEATFNLEWVGSGSITHIEVDGVLLSEPRLNLRADTHTVVIYLGATAENNG